MQNAKFRKLQAAMPANMRVLLHPYGATISAYDAEELTKAEDRVAALRAITTLSLD
jgi:hypothetical protein